jgi:type II restriction enzyme
MMPDAVRHFWDSRSAAAMAQEARGNRDQGNRAGVTAGKNLDGFAAMVRQIIVDNGIDDADVLMTGRATLTIPGFFRPTKNWDLLVVRRGKLIAAVEFKSQVSPSFGNNFNNRVEEALGNATDLLTAFREGAFGEGSRPFLGFFFVLEDCPQSTRPVGYSSSHFKAFPEFDNTSYAQRYEILCRKLVQENLYDSASVVLTKAEGNEFRVLSDLTSPHRFAATLAGRMAGMAIE